MFPKKMSFLVLKRADQAQQIIDPMILLHLPVAVEVDLKKIKIKNIKNKK